jgi:crotonobetainyl-CoA:carnitine CoA-transferase CaiB-like acyl-CoA transferase
MEQALSDVTVLDLGQVVAMPFCTMLLADLGARVIKVESRGRERVSLGIKREGNGAEERVPAAQYCERNKLATSLELKTAQGAALFKELVRHADVVAENFSVGTMDRLRLGYETLRQVNPAIIYASVTAFGQHGPYAHQRGYDILAQPHQRLPVDHGVPGEPTHQVGPVDLRLFRRDAVRVQHRLGAALPHRTGKGRRIDMALLDSLVVALDNPGERYTVGGEILTRSGQRCLHGLQHPGVHDQRRPRRRVGREEGVI